MVIWGYFRLADFPEKINWKKKVLTRSSEGLWILMWVQWENFLGHRSEFGFFATLSLYIIHILHSVVYSHAYTTTILSYIPNPFWSLVSWILIGSLLSNFHIDHFVDVQLLTVAHVRGFTKYWHAFIPSNNGNLHWKNMIWMMDIS